MKRADEKTNVLLHQLNERYAALRDMRERSYKFTLWILGFGIGMAWLVTGEKALTLTRRWTLALFALVLGGLAFYLLRVIQKGYRINARIVERIETSLGLFKPGAYMPGQTILPEMWKKPPARLRRNSPSAGPGISIPCSCCW